MLRRTAAPRPAPLAAVALLAGARQRRFGPRRLEGTGFRKVGGGSVVRSRGRSRRRLQPPYRMDAAGPRRLSQRAPPLPSRGEEAGAPRLRSVVDRGGLLAVHPNRGRSRAGRVSRLRALRTLAIRWLHPTRLETRTKESSLCASLRVRETRRRNESEGAPSARAEARTRRALKRGGRIVDRSHLRSRKIRVRAHTLGPERW